MDSRFDGYLDVLPNVIIAFLIGFLLTPLLKKIGLKYGFATKGKKDADKNERGYITRPHDYTMPRLGEFAMLTPLFLLIWHKLNLNIQLLGIISSLSLVAFVGILDSKYHLSEFVKLPLLIFASIILVFTGTVLSFGIGNGAFLNNFGPSIINPVNNSTLYMAPVLLSIFWFVLIPTALSYVGGVDGLSEGTSAIAIFIITLIGIRTGNTLTITLGSVAFGGLLGLLPYNFYPASIYSEHLIYGFLIAILAITSQAKISTSVLLLIIPILDFLYLCFVRTKKYLKSISIRDFRVRMWLNALGTGDKNHFHHKMQSLGWGARRIAIVQYLLYLGLGLLAMALSGLFLTFFIVSASITFMLILYIINRLIFNHE